MVVGIYSTFSGLSEAQKIARVLIKDKLVACVNIIPQISSIYRWEDKIEEGAECAFLAKTTEEKVDVVIQKIKKLHSYNVPDIIVIPVIGGLPAYLTYVEDMTK